VVEVVDAPEVFICDHGHTGKLSRPTKAQLEDAFHTTKFDDIFQFMAQHGHLQSTGHHSTLNPHDQMNKYNW
jgi:ribosome maturation protein Sdo1